MKIGMKKILILEDEKIVSSFIKECFEKQWFEATIIEDNKTDFNANDYSFIFVDRDLVYQDENGKEVVSNYHDYFLQQTEKKEIDKVSLLAKTYYISGNMLNNDYLANKLIMRAMEEWAENNNGFCFEQEDYLLQFQYFAKMAEMNKHCKINNAEFKQKIEELAERFK